MTAKDYIVATERELAGWPGVTFDSASAGKHEVLTLYYRRGSRKVFFAKSPSDNGHGLANHLGVVRRELIALGASKLKQSPSNNRHRERNRPDRAPVITQGPAPVVPPPFAALADLKKELSMTRTIEINGKTVTIERGKAPPPASLGRGREKGDLRLLLEAMQDGESVFLPIDHKGTSGRLTAAGKALGCRFMARKEADGLRIYRIAGKPAPRVNGAAKAAQPQQPARTWA